VRLTDLAVLYLVVGAGCAWALRARRPDARGLADALLTVGLWPLYVPALLGGERPDPAAPRSASPRIERERALLYAALDAAQARLSPGALTQLLPTRAQLAALTAHLEHLDAKVRELDEVLAGEEFDLARAERRLREADPAGVEAATAAFDGARRLAGLRERAARERDELLGLFARLRMQVTVLRFTEGAPGEHLGELVAEMLARIEGVGAALDPGVASAR
jgi:hypothetical protein